MRLGGLAMRLARFLSAFAVIVVISSANSSAAQTADPIAPYRAQREAVLDGFRVGGSHSTPLASSIRRGVSRPSFKTPRARRAPEP